MIPEGRKANWHYWEVAELIRDGALDIGDGYRAKNSEMGTLGLPFARAGNVNNGFHFDEADILSEESVKLAGDKLSRVGDVTFTSKGTFGRFAFVREDTPPFVYSPQLCYWRVKREGLVDRRFLYYWMQSADCMNQLNQVKGLTDMADYVSLANQRKMWLSAPPLPIQRRVAGILSSYDDLIENNLRRIRILEEMARALYREWFVQFRFPCHESTPRVASSLGPIPQGWKVKRLDEIAENFDRLRRPLSKMERAGMQGEYPYYGAAKVFDYVNNYIFDGEYLLMAEDGSVITTERAPVLQLVNEKFWPNNHTHVLRGKAPVSTHFLFLGLSLVDISPYITGAAQPKITQENMNRISFFCGPNDLHRDFDRLVAPMIHQSQVLQRQTANLRRSRDLLLPRLLSGQALPELA